MAGIRELNKAPWEEDDEPQEVDKAPWEEDISEDEGMALATGAADRKFQETEPGLWETAGGQFAQGLTFGTADEAAAYLAKESGWSYDDAKQKINQRLLRQRVTNRGTAFTADLLGSIVSSFIPGLGIAKGAKLGATMGKAAGLGAAEGFARGEGDLGDRAKNAAVTAGFSGAAPLAGPILKGAGKLAKSVFPGSSTSPRIVNKMTAGLAKITSKMDDDTGKAYQEMLNDAEVMKKAFTSPKEVMAKVPEMNETMGKTFKNIKDVISKQYDKKQVEAFTKNVQDTDEFLVILDGYKKDIADAIRKVDSDPDFYSPKTKQFLTRVQSVIGLKDPKVGDLATSLEKIQKQAIEAAEKGDVEAFERISKEYTAELPKLGGALIRARRYLDEGIDFKRTDSFSDDQELLKGLRDKIQTLTHDLSRGSKEMLEADRLYTDFKRKAEPFMEQFKGKGPDGMSGKKVGDFISGAGSAYKQAEIKQFHDAAVEFLNKNGLQKESKEISDLITNFDQMRNRLELGRVGGQTGATTGRSTAPLILGGAATYVGGPAVGATVALLSTPITSPTAYASTLNTIRKQIASIGESAVAQKFGQAWPAIKSALARRIGTQDDVREAATEIKNAAGGKASELFQQSTGLDTGRIPEKIRTYFKGGGQNQGASVGPQQTPRQQYQQFFDNQPEMIPKGSTFGGRAQVILDDLIGAESIGLDPGEEMPKSQPSEADRKTVARMAPFFPAGTVTKLNPKLRKRLLEKRKSKELDKLYFELNRTERGPRFTELQDKIDDIRGYAPRPERAVKPPTSGNDPGKKIKEYLKGEYDPGKNIVIYSGEKGHAWEPIEYGVFGKHVKKGFGDPFNWGQDKHKITKNFLDKNGKDINEIHTRSDLIAHDDYIDALRKNSPKAKIRIYLSPGNSRTVSVMDPGIPSNKRRMNAARKLKEQGFNVELRTDVYRHKDIDNTDPKNILKPEGSLADGFMMQNNYIDLTDIQMEKIKKNTGFKPKDNKDK